MKTRAMYLCLIIGLVLIIITATAAVDVSSGGDSPTPTPTGTPPKVTITPRPTPHIPFGEVVYPITPRATPTPIITRPSATSTPIITPTTVRATPVTTRTTVTASPTTVPRTTVTLTPVVTPTTVGGTPVITPTTVSQSPTVSPTTIPVTLTTTAPVVTVTVFVYRSGPIFSPYYEALYTPDYSSGSLTVTSNPSGAVVILDGINSETTPFIFTGLSTGYHTVEVDYPGYQAYIHNVYVDSGTNIEVNADLTNLGYSGSLFVDSTPQGADAYVDGNHQGTTPVTVSALSPGDHQVELHLAGYEVLSSTEYVAAGQVTTVNLALVPYSPVSVYGSIDITSSVPGAVVYLDGIYKGTTQPGNTFNIISIDPGSHDLILHVPGYTDFQQTVQVYTGQISDVNAVLTQIPVNQQGTSATSPAVGSIIVTSAPTGGQVYVDNQFRGVAPVTIYNVAPGTHIINLKLAGYSDYSTSVDVPANQVVQVPATFIPGGGPATVPTRAGLTPLVFIIALAFGGFVMVSRYRK
jgi:hypothetical protein